MTIYTKPHTGKHRWKKTNKTMKIKVIIQQTVYYDAYPKDDNVKEALGENPTPSALAEYDGYLFRNGDISWDDLFDRSDVTFEGVEID